MRWNEFGILTSYMLTYYMLTDYITYLEWLHTIYIQHVSWRGQLPNPNHIEIIRVSLQFFPITPVVFIRF